MAYEEWIMLSGRLAFVVMVAVGILCGMYWKRLSGIKRLLLFQVMLLLLGWGLLIRYTETLEPSIDFLPPPTDFPAIRHSAAKAGVPCSTLAWACRIGEDIGQW